MSKASSKRRPLVQDGIDRLGHRQQQQPGPNVDPGRSQVGERDRTAARLEEASRAAALPLRMRRPRCLREAPPAASSLNAATGPSSEKSIEPRGSLEIVAWLGSSVDVEGAELADLDLVVERPLDDLALGGYQLDHEFRGELCVALGGESADRRRKPRDPLVRHREQA